MTGDPFPVIRMKELIAINSLQPLFKSNAQVIEQDAVGIKTFATGSEYSGVRTFATGSEYSNKLRNDVDYLTELRFLFADLEPVANVLTPLYSEPVANVFMPTAS